MAYAAFGSWKTYQPSVNGPETMAGSGGRPKTADFRRSGYGGAVIML
jgi:hypothetical protein